MARLIILRYLAVQIFAIVKAAEEQIAAERAGLDRESTFVSAAQSLIERRRMLRLSFALDRLRGAL